MYSLFPSIAALAQPAISFQFTISEDPGDRYVNACVEISSLPANGSECNAVIYLVAQSDTASTSNQVIKHTYIMYT